jgi:integrase
MAERSPGTWRLRVYIKETGEQVQRTFKGNRTAAGEALAKLQTEVEEGKFDHTKATVGELLDKWLEQLETVRQRRPSTLLGYKRKIEHDIRPALGSIALAKLDAADLDDLYGDQLTRGLSNATVHQMHAIVSAACHQAVKWGWITANPAENATPPAVRNPRMTVPSREEIAKLYTAARELDPVLGMAVALAVMLGARRGEICALRRSDVDLVNGRVSISRSLTVADGETHIGDTKTHSASKIALDDEGIGLAVFRDWWEYQSNLSKRADSPLVADPYLLSYNANAGRPVSPDTISHRFAAVAKAQGVSCHFHSLRHWSVTEQLAAGIDVPTVSRRHSHASAKMTLDRYAEALPERDRAAAGVTARALPSGR